MNRQYFPKIFHATTGKSSWRQIFTELFPKKQLDNASVIETSRQSLNSNSVPLENGFLSPSQQTLEQITWIGNISYQNEQPVGIHLILKDENSLLSGRLQFVDPVDFKLIELSEMSGSRVGDNITLISPTNLRIVATLQSNSLTGTVVFPPRNYEPELEASISLTPSNKIYLPIIIR